MPGNILHIGYLVVKEAPIFFVQLTIKCRKTDDNKQVSNVISDRSRYSEENQTG